MTLTASDIQAAINNDAYVYVPKGTHNIDTPILVTGHSHVVIEGSPSGHLVYTGPPGKPLFEHYRTGSGNNRVEFRDLVATTTQPRSAIIGNTKFGTLAQIHFWIFQRCIFESPFYCFDFNNIDYSSPQSWRDIITSGGGALRLTGGSSSDGANEPWWPSTLSHVQNWHHTGSNRVGPAFDYRGAAGINMENVTDTGDPGLATELRGNYEGPISLRINSPRTASWVKNYDATGIGTDWSNASGCWLHTIRSDNPMALHDQQYLTLDNVTLENAGVPAAFHVQIMGGHTAGNPKALVCELVRCGAVDISKISYGGRLWLKATMPFYDDSTQSAIRTATVAALDAINPDSVRDILTIDTDKVPSANSSTASTYTTGLSLYDNYVADTSGDYEDYLP